MTSGEAAVGRFGDRDGAHSLLDYSGGTRADFERILMFTDRPPDLELQEVGRVYAGYASKDVYVVQLTEPDHLAKRAGMVRTTAVLIPGAALADVNLAAAFEQLRMADALAPLPLVDLLGGPPAPDPPGLGAMVDALIGTRKAVWVGDGFEPAVAALWGRLAASDRTRLVFGSAVHANGVSLPRVERALVVVKTLARYAGRWDWPRASVEDSSPASHAGEALLCVDHGARALAERLGRGDVELEEWGLLAAAHARLEQLSTLNHEGTRALAQLLGRLVPDPGTGEDVKAPVIDRLRELTPAATFEDVRGLRALPWRALGREPLLQDVLAEWSRATWADADRHAELASAIIETGNHEDPFAVELAAQLSAAVRDRPGSLAAQAAAALSQPLGERVLTWLAASCSRSQLDNALADRAAANAPPWLAAFARKKRLGDTHAASVSVADPVVAWRTQLDMPDSTSRAYDRLESRTGAAGLVSAAVALEEPALVKRAGPLIAAAPELLPRPAAETPVVRALWAESIRAGADPWAVEDPKRAAKTLLSELAGGAEIDPLLLEAVADSPGADLSEHSDRPQLWSLLPPEARERMLAATAKSMAPALSPGTPVPEPDLQRAMLASGVLGPLARRDAAQAITVLEVVPCARAQHALVVMRNGRFVRADAIRFGRLVTAQRWSSVAAALIDAVKGRPDLQPAAHEAQAILSLWDRLRRAFGQGGAASAVAKPDELRAALVDQAVELYPKGPTDRALWERAGGNEADLPQQGTGREAWRSALQAVDSGRRGAPKRNDLLTQMLDDHPHNQDLALLAEAFRG